VNLEPAATVAGQQQAQQPAKLKAKPPAVQIAKQPLPPSQPQQEQPGLQAAARAKQQVKNGKAPQKPKQVS